MCILQVVNDTSSQTQKCSSVAATPDIPPFKEMTSHCEALSMGNHHKMSVLMSFKHSKQAAMVPNNQVNRVEALYRCITSTTNQDLKISKG